MNLKGRWNHIKKPVNQGSYNKAVNSKINESSLFQKLINQTIPTQENIKLAKKETISGPDPNCRHISLFNSPTASTEEPQITGITKINEHRTAVSRKSPANKAVTK